MRVLSVVGRTVWAAVVLALVAAVVVLAGRVPADSAAPRAAAPVEVPPAPSVLVCPGPLRLATEQDGTDADYDPAFDPSPVDATSLLGAVTSRRGDEQPAPAAGTRLGDGAAALAVAPAVEGGVAGASGVQGPVVLRAEPTGDAPPWLAGALAWRAGTGDLRGLAAASCQRPAPRTWLVGGSTALGASARLVLQNPGATPASVTLRVWGPSGALELAGAPEYLVVPGEEEVVLLEGVAAEQPHMVVEVTAQGGLVAAYLQDSRTDGLVPAGVDLVTGSAPPATTQVVPAVAVDDGGDALVRLLAPGEEDAVVDVVLLGPDGVVRLPGAEGIGLRAGEVLDVPLDGLEPGDYTVVVTADVPVVAGAAVTRVGEPEEEGDDPPVERAWSPSVAPGTEGPVALPGDVPARLVLGAVPGPAASTGSAVATVEALDAAGAVLERREVRVGAGSSVTLPLDELEGGRPAALVVRTEDAHLAWAVVLDAGDAISVVAPVAQQGDAPAVPVTVR